MKLEITINHRLSVCRNHGKLRVGYEQLSHSETRSANRTAVGGTVSIPVVNAIQGMQQVNKARERTDDPRMQTLAAATLVMQVGFGLGGSQNGFTLELAAN